MNTSKQLIVQKGRFVGVRGIACDVTTKTRAAGKASALLEVHCQVNGVRVVTVHGLSDSVFITEGDELVLAGYTKAGVLVPLAWWNCSKHKGPARRGWDTWLWFAAFAVVMLSLSMRVMQGRILGGHLVAATVKAFLAGVYFASCVGHVSPDVMLRAIDGEMRGFDTAAGAIWANLTDRGARQVIDLVKESRMGSSLGLIAEGATGSVKLWVQDGRLSKLEVLIEGRVAANTRSRKLPEIDLKQTYTFTFDGFGTSDPQVSNEALELLAAVRTE